VITEIEADDVAQGVAYDIRGNLSVDDGFDTPSDDGFAYSYDAENRLTEVEYDDGTNPLIPVASYRYDAMGRRIVFADHVRGTTVHYYYDGQNVIAEYTYTEPNEVPTEEVARSYVNGTQYIDERVSMRDHTPAAGDRADHYYLLAELYTVVGLAGPNGELEEAYVYDTYGAVRVYHWPRGDFDRNGDMDTDDQTIFGASSGGDGNHPESCSRLCP
jgi:hypothetical protein